MRVQTEWQKIQMQGSDLDKVERKFAELEFSIREKNKAICQRYPQLMNKMERGSQGTVDVLDLKEQILQLTSQLDREFVIDNKLRTVKRRLDNYYTLGGGVCAETGLNQKFDDDMKIIMVE